VCIQTWLIMASPKPRCFSCHFVNGKNQYLPIQYHYIPQIGLTPYHEIIVMLPKLWITQNLGCTRRTWTHREGGHTRVETHTSYKVHNMLRELSLLWVSRCYYYMSDENFGRSLFSKLVFSKLRLLRTKDVTKYEEDINHTCIALTTNTINRTFKCEVVWCIVDGFVCKIF
jgi:hypothetical protein